MRVLAAIGTVFCLAAQQVSPPEPPGPEAPAFLTNEGKPMKVTASCTEADIQTLGMACSAEHPCPVFLELSTLESVSNRLFAAGNLHTDSATLATIVLVSEDGGKTWREPHPRTPYASLDQMQFFDLETGWISGQVVGALPRDPFFLLTTDGGKSWRQRSILSEAGAGSIESFAFESRTQGSVVVDRSAGAEGGRFALFETQTGGDTWSIRSLSPDRTALKTRDVRSQAWRLQPHAASKAYRVERRDAAGKWNPIASFLLNAGECKPEEVVLREPPPEPTPADEKIDEFQLGNPPKKKKK